MPFFLGFAGSRKIGSIIPFRVAAWYNNQKAAATQAAQNARVIRAEGGERHQSETKRKRGKPLAFIRDLIDRYYAHDVARDGAALTYYLLFAIFPAAGVRQHPGGLDGSGH